MPRTTGDCIALYQGVELRFVMSVFQHADGESIVAWRLGRSDSVAMGVEPPAVAPSPLANFSNISITGKNDCLTLGRCMSGQVFEDRRIEPELSPHL